MRRSRKWFPHKVGFYNERKIKRLRYNHGIQGYVTLIFIMEYLWTKDNFEDTYSSIVEYLKEFNIEQSLIDSVLNDHNLFNVNGFIYRYVFMYKGKPIKPFKEDKRLYNTNVKLWYEIRKQVFERDNYTCQYCGKIGGKLEADHIVPFSKGGEDIKSNLTTACRKCNRQKKDKSVEEFKEWREKNG